MSFLEIFGSGFLLVITVMTALWLASLLLRDASIVDPFWGTGFVLLAWFYFLQSGEGLAAHKVVVVTLVTLWGLRLSIYLLWRNWGKGEDYRYRGFRRKYGPARYWWVSYFQVFLLQGALMWLLSGALLAAQYGSRSATTSLTILDGLAITVWAAGFFFETIGDWQLARFKRNPANSGRVLDTGLWRYTRHPNYFGDSLVWLGFGLLAMATGDPLAIVAGLLSAGLMAFLLRRVSGVTLLERSLAKKKPGYAAYVARTSPFFPRPPKPEITAVDQEVGPT